MHKLIFTARLTKDADLRYTGDGKAVATVPMAINEGYGDKKQTIWIKGSLWGKRAESLSQYLVKGTLVHVEATLSHKDGNPRVWESNGEHRASFECYIQEIDLLGGGSKQTAEDDGDDPW
jgi:single-strand DNA-binding protein